jgi:hypothetical protein
MANLATVHAFRREIILAQWFSVLGAFSDGQCGSTQVGLSLGDILETVGKRCPARLETDSGETSSRANELGQFEPTANSQRRLLDGIPEF